jgi:hypothetical protein
VKICTGGEECDGFAGIFIFVIAFTPSIKKGAGWCEGWHKGKGKQVHR